MKNVLYHLILGSNLGDRLAQLQLARELITWKVGNIDAASALYETQPWGFDDQPWYLNQAIAISSPLEPDELLYSVKEIEKKAGRLEGERWHARHIDIDILLCGDLVTEKNDLIIPHPLLHTRNFVLIPLMEIAAHIIHPVLQKSIEELFLECRDTGEVYIFNADEPDHAI